MGCTSQCWHVQVHVSKLKTYVSVLHLYSTVFPLLNAWALFLTKGAYPACTRDQHLFSVNCEYGNEHNEHAVAVLKDGEIVGHFPRTI